jgi:hypothetical protein
MSSLKAAPLMAVSALLFACTASAQESGSGAASRAATIEHAQAEKAKDLHPYVPNTAERVIARLENGFFAPPVGPYPWFGSVLSGGGFAIGPGYRRPFGEDGVLNVYAGWSIKNYKTVDAHVHLPEAANGRLLFDVRARWVDAPRVSYFGLGNDSVKADRTSFDYEPLTVGLNVAVQPVWFFEVGGGADYLRVNTGPGSGAVSIEERFTSATAPGLGTDPDYVRSRVYAQLDSRDAPGYTRRGTLLRAEYSDYSQRKGDGFSFGRVDVDARQFIPVLRENWVIALRALASYTDAAAGEDVPFFLLPSLGGGSDLRSYSSFRFRDRNRLLLSGEFRWMPSHFLDMALFYDAGKVAEHRSDLDLDGMKHSYGIGARFHTPSANVLRIEYARGREGGRLVFAGGPSF